MKNEQEAKRRENRAETLSEELFKADEMLLDAMCAVDDAEKLAGYVRSQRKKACGVVKPLRKIAIAAAALILAVGVALALPFWQNIGVSPSGGDEETSGAASDETSSGSGDSTDSSRRETNAITIDSFDKLNYYAAKKMLGDHRADALSSASGTVSALFRSDSFDRENGGIRLLADLTETDRGGTNPDESYMGEEETDDGKMGAKDVVGFCDIGGETFTITTAIHFVLQVTTEDEFLASRVGVGEVEAVITDLKIGRTSYAMITFKNGDAYFSCLSEMDELSGGENRFYTHLYIKGFYFYKDLTQGISTFRVNFDAENETVLSVDWIPYHRRPAEAPVYPLALLENSTEVSFEYYEFTLYELEEYYNGASDTAGEESESDGVQTESVTVGAGENSVSPLSCPLWSEFYDESSGMWADEAFGGAYEVLTSGDTEVPFLPLWGEVTSDILGNGTLLHTDVYYRNENGEYVLSETFNRQIENLDDLLTAGEWYVVLTVEWRGDYVSSAGRYERHCTEYLFGLTVG